MQHVMEMADAVAGKFAGMQRQLKSMASQLKLSQRS